MVPHIELNIFFKIIGLHVFSHVATSSNFINVGTSCNVFNVRTNFSFLSMQVPNWVKVLLTPTPLWGRLPLLMIDDFAPLQANTLCRRKAWCAKRWLMWRNALARQWVWNWNALVSNYTNFWERWDWIRVFCQFIYIEHIVNACYNVWWQTL